MSDCLCALNFKFTKNIDGTTTLVFDKATNILDLESISALIGSINEIDCSSIVGGTAQFYIIYCDTINAQTGNIVKIFSKEIHSETIINKETITTKVLNADTINSINIHNKENIDTETLVATTSAKIADIFINKNSIKALEQSEEDKTTELNISLEAIGDLNLTTFKPKEGDDGKGNITLNSWGEGDIKLTANLTGKIDDKGDTRKSGNISLEVINEGGITLKADNQNSDKVSGNNINILALGKNDIRILNEKTKDKTERGAIYLDGIKISYDDQDNCFIEQTNAEKNLYIKNTAGKSLFLQAKESINVESENSFDLKTQNANLHAKKSLFLQAEEFINIESENFFDLETQNANLHAKKSLFLQAKESINVESENSFDLKTQNANLHAKKDLNFIADGLIYARNPLHLMSGNNYLCHLPKRGVKATYKWPEPPSFLNKKKA